MMPMMPVKSRAPNRWASRSPTSSVTMAMNSSMTAEQNRRYGPLVQAVIAQSAAYTGRGLRAEKVAQVIARAVTAQRPRTRYAVGRDAAVLTRLSRVLPDRALDRIVAAGVRLYYPAAG